MSKGTSFAELWMVFAGLALVLMVGCTRTVVGGYTNSPDKKLRVYGRVYGQYGRPFLEQTRKKVRISIVALANTSETLLLRKEHLVQGFDVGWDASWDERNNLTVVIYDYGPGIDGWDARKNGSPTNHLRTLIYRFDPKTQTFTEDSPKS